MAFAIAVPSGTGLTLSQVGFEGQVRSSTTLRLLPATLAPGDERVAYSGKRYLAASVMVGQDHEIDVYNLAQGAARVASIPTDVEEFAWGPGERLVVFSIRPMTMAVFDGDSQTTTTTALSKDYVVHQPSWASSGSGVMVAEVDAARGLPGESGVLDSDGSFRPGAVVPYLATGLEPMPGPDGSRFAVRPFNPPSDMTPSWVTLDPSGRVVTWHVDQSTADQWYWANWLAADGPAVALALRDGTLAIGTLAAPDDAGTWRELGVEASGDTDVQLQGLAADASGIIAVVVSITRGDRSELDLFHLSSSGVELVGPPGLSGLFAGFARDR